MRDAQSNPSQGGLSDYSGIQTIDFQGKWSFLRKKDLECLLHDTLIMISPDADQLFIISLLSLNVINTPYIYT